MVSTYSPWYVGCEFNGAGCWTKSGSNPISSSGSGLSGKLFLDDDVGEGT